MALLSNKKFLTLETVIELQQTFLALIKFTYSEALMIHLSKVSDFSELKD